MKAVIQYKREAGPMPGHFKVFSTPYLRELYIKLWRGRGWTYFVKFQDVNGYGLSVSA